MRIHCPTCKTAVDLDNSAAGNLVRCRSCGRSFIAPQELAVTGQRHTLTAFSVPGIVLLHFASVGLFPLVHFNMMHDRLPRLRKSDPTGFVAVALCFVPGVHLLWLFFTLRRLCVRVNEQRRFTGLPETAPQSLALIVPTLLICGLAGTIFPLTGWVVLGATLSVLAPVFVSMLQASVNELVAAGDAAGEPSDTEDHGAGRSQSRGSLRGGHRNVGPTGERGPVAGASADRGR